ncbi:hypothetical protein ACHAXA_005387 [Cyclostephanos tholiformis]|uniref:Uncharacterized protein n=1 Tax=Cyclostephanos tholiformis TaxID=382380 RepID=A0ABD3RKB5_9STRA
MRSATLIFLLAPALFIDSSSATSTTTIRGDDRLYADALEELEREMTRMGHGGGGDGVGGVPRMVDGRDDDCGGGGSRPSRSTTDDAHAAYRSHRPWKGGRIEELEGMRRRASEALADRHIDGTREVLDERDLSSLSRWMAALDGKMRSETEEWYLERVEYHERGLIDKFERRKHKHAEEGFGRRRRMGDDKIEL